MSRIQIAHSIRVLANYGTACRWREGVSWRGNKERGYGWAWRERERGVAKREDRGTSMSRSISRPLGNNVDLPACLPHVGRKRTALRPFEAPLSSSLVVSAPAAFFFNQFLAHIKVAKSLCACAVHGHCNL